MQGALLLNIKTHIDILDVIVHFSVFLNENNACSHFVFFHFVVTFGPRSSGATAVSSRKRRGTNTHRSVGRCGEHPGDRVSSAKGIDLGVFCWMNSMLQTDSVNRFV